MRRRVVREAGTRWPKGLAHLAAWQHCEGCAPAACPPCPKAHRGTPPDYAPTCLSQVMEIKSSHDGKLAQYRSATVQYTGDRCVCLRGGACRVPQQAWFLQGARCQAGVGSAQLIAGLAGQPQARMPHPTSPPHLTGMDWPCRASAAPHSRGGG